MVAFPKRAPSRGWVAAGQRARRLRQEPQHLVSQGDTQSPRRQRCPGRGIPGGLLPNSLPLAARCRQRPLSGRGMGGNSISPRSAPSPQARTPKATTLLSKKAALRLAAVTPGPGAQRARLHCPRAVPAPRRHPGLRVPAAETRAAGLPWGCRGSPCPPLWHPHPEPDAQSGARCAEQRHRAAGAYFYPCVYSCETGLLEMH